MTALIRNMKIFIKKKQKQPSDNCWSQHPSDPWTWSFTRRLLSLTIDESVSGPLSSLPPPLSLLALPPLLPDCYFSWRRAETALQLDVVPSANMGWCIIKRCMWSPTEAHIVGGQWGVLLSIFAARARAQRRGSTRRPQAHIHHPVLFAPVASHKTSDVHCDWHLFTGWVVAVWSPKDSVGAESGFHQLNFFFFFLNQRV